MKLSQIAGKRLISQQLTGSSIKSAPEMVRWIGAVQGQEYAQTKWGLGLRLPHLIEEDIEKDLTDGRILRTHMLRPTWHFVSAEDIRWILEKTITRFKEFTGKQEALLEGEIVQATFENDEETW